MSKAKDNIEVFGASTKEYDTYDFRSRKEKEKISGEDIRKHWDIRAQRPDIQSVMSTRHTLKENKQITIRLQQEVFKFLGGLVEGKKVFELGVGVGRMTVEITKRAEEVAGVDLSLGMLKRAKQNLKDFDNVRLLSGKIVELDLPPKSFDLVFAVTVLAHILNPKELRATAKKMRELSDAIFIAEATYESRNPGVSKYTILRKAEEYRKLFAPYRIKKQKTFLYAGDILTFILFEKP